MDEDYESRASEAAAFALLSDELRMSISEALYAAGDPSRSRTCSTKST